MRIHFCLILQNTWQHTPRILVNNSHLRASSHLLHQFCMENNSDGHIFPLPMGWIFSTSVLRKLLISQQSWTWCSGPGCSSPPSPSSFLQAPPGVCEGQTKGRRSPPSYTNSFPGAPSSSVLSPKLTKFTGSEIYFIFAKFVFWISRSPLESRENKIPFSFSSRKWRII